LTSYFSWTFFGAQPWERRIDALNMPVLFSLSPNQDGSAAPEGRHAGGSGTFSVDSQGKSLRPNSPGISCPRELPGTGEDIATTRQTGNFHEYPHWVAALLPQQDRPGLSYVREPFWSLDLQVPRKSRISLRDLYKG
jgi:hypothetical protein